jgi:hypothetical protein
MPAVLHVRIERVASNVVLRFTQASGVMVVTPQMARAIAARLHTIADAVDPPPASSNGRPRGR